jgi:hypothetical protein
MSRVSIKATKVAPAEQETIATYAVVTGSALDASVCIALSYTILVADEDIKWKVMGANKADYSDEVEVQAEATVLADGVSSYAISNPPYAYYRVKVADNVGGTHGNVTVNGIAKG